MANSTTILRRIAAVFSDFNNTLSIFAASCGAQLDFDYFQDYFAASCGVFSDFEQILKILRKVCGRLTIFKICGAEADPQLAEGCGADPKNGFILRRGSGSALRRGAATMPDPMGIF